MAEPSFQYPLPFEPERRATDKQRLRRAFEARFSSHELIARAKIEIANSKALMAEIDRILATR